MQRYATNMYEGMLAETMVVRGNNGKAINAYFARPLGAGPFPGIVLIHHAPGWDELYKEFTRKFAYHGYLAICPNHLDHLVPRCQGRHTWWELAGHGVPPSNRMDSPWVRCRLSRWTKLTG